MLRHTIPTDLHHSQRPSPNPMDNALYAIRECFENAKGWGATNSSVLLGVLPTDSGPMDVLVVMHNGEPFEDMTDLTEKGVTPNISGGRTGSLQGYGLTSCAGYLSSQPELIIASHCKDGKLGIARGFPDRSTNTWVREDVTERMQKPLRKLLGAKTLGSFSVVYIFLIDLNTKANRQYFNTASMTSLTFMSDVFNDVKLSFSEKQIGCDSYTTGRGAGQTHDDTAVDKYSSYDEAKKISGTSNVARPICGISEYEHKFMDRAFDFSATPFKIQLASVPPTFMSVSKSTVKVRAFSGLRKSDEQDETRHGWLVNGRDSTEINSKGRPRYTRGSMSAEGKLPDMNTFLQMSYISTSMQSGSKNNPYVRFAQGTAVYCTKDCSDTMSALDLCYNPPSHRQDTTKDKPFVTVHIDVQEVDRIWQVKNDGKEVDLEFDGAQVANWLNRRPDFLMGQKDLCRRIILEAARGAKASVSPEDREYFEKMFPFEKPDTLPLLYGEKEIRVVNNRPSPFEVFNLRTGKLFDGNFHTGESAKIAIWDRDTSRFLDISLIKLNPRNRGIEIADMTSSVTHNGRDGKKIKENATKLSEEKGVTSKKRIPIISVNVSEMERLETVGDTKVWKPCGKKEYSHMAGFQPSRSVQLILGEISRNTPIGIVVEVPKRQPSPTHGNPNSHETTTAKEYDKKDKNLRPFWDRHLFFLARWDEVRNILLLNGCNSTIKRVFMPVGVRVGSEPHRMICDMYAILNGLARLICPTLIPGESGLKVNIEPPMITGYESEENPPAYEDNGYDYVLNEVLRGFVATNVDFLKREEKLMKLVGDVPAASEIEDEDEAEAELQAV